MQNRSFNLLLRLLLPGWYLYFASTRVPAIFLLHARFFTFLWRIFVIFQVCCCWIFLCFTTVFLLLLGFFYIHGCFFLKATIYLLIENSYIFSTNEKQELRCSVNGLIYWNFAYLWRYRRIIIVFDLSWKQPILENYELKKNLHFWNRLCWYKMCMKIKRPNFHAVIPWINTLI